VLRLTRYEFNREYIERLVAGDQETEQHFVRYFGDLLSLKLRSRLRSAAAIDDAKQETFLRVLTTLKEKGGLASAGSLGAFVNSVCNNVLFEIYRAQARAVPIPDDTDEPTEDRPGVESELMTAEEHARVRQALGALPERETEILRWLFFEDRDKNEVCRELNVDRNYLRVLVHRAKARFRDALTATQSAAAEAAPNG
jgi:RNA polymerase sigma-70 factor (ECF subfamily)